MIIRHQQVEPWLAAAYPDGPTADLNIKLCLLTQFLAILGLGVFKTAPRFGHPAVAAASRGTTGNQLIMNGINAVFL